MTTITTLQLETTPESMRLQYTIQNLVQRETKENYWCHEDIIAALLHGYIRILQLDLWKDKLAKKKTSCYILA
jgi:hypothetical protein